MGYMIRLSHATEIDGEACFNVYHYWYNGTGDGTKHLCQQFAAWIVPGIRTFQIAGCVHKYLKAQQVTNISNQYILGLADVGGTAGSANGLPNQNAMKFRMGTWATTPSQPTHGSKAYPGLGNSSSAWGDVTSAIAAAMLEFAPLLASALIDPDGVSHFPMVIRMLSWANKYYISAAVTSAVHRVKISSQDSRQGNSGALSYLSEFDVINDTVPSDPGFNSEWKTDDPFQLSTSFLIANGIHGAVSDSVSERLF